jgi:hypothetical protein
MKLSNAFDSIERENRFLRLLTTLLVILSAFLIGVLYLNLDKPPLLVERSSRGFEIVRPTDQKRTDQDLTQATKLMLQARFTSEAIAPELFINQKQLLLRETEQREMKSRNMLQNIVVRSVEVEKESVTAEIDRVISVGELRSALKARLKINFEEVSPNELNPYGLLLSLAEPINEQKEQNK